MIKKIIIIYYKIINYRNFLYEIYSDNSCSNPTVKEAVFYWPSTSTFIIDKDNCCNINPTHYGLN